ncbi:MAG: squalene synthase HpnC [Planctomycetaceae bacterium]|nr:squalene synthase HpnC [Planctomycetaceae bacterium]
MLKDSYSYCKKLAKSHYENFTVASFLLRKELREPFYAIYAYCRISDDLSDESSSPAHALDALADWQRQLDRCFEGKIQEGDSPIFPALKDVVEKHGLSKEPFYDLLEAFRRDQIQARYETWNELLDYCRCSANPVGRMVLQLGASVAKDSPPTDEMLRCSDAICTALQLANFWQDVARDWKIGRFYVPMEYCREFLYDPELQPQQTPAFEKMLRELCRRTRELFDAGAPLVGMVPRLIRTEVALFLGGGRAILDAIEAINYQVWLKRPVVSKWKKFSLLMGITLGRRF